MNLEFLRTKIDERFPNVEAFASVMSLSKQAVYDWLGKRTIPEESRIFDIVDALKLSETEIDALLGTPPTLVFFRKKGLAAPDAQVIERSRELADTFFKIDGSSYIVKNTFFSGASTSDPLAIASYIRALLGKLAHEPVCFDDLLIELKKHNVSVFFLPFRRIGLVFGPSRSREVAFTAKKESRVIIFVDTDRTIDEATLDICHELVHLILNHDEPTQDDERLCTRVAGELIYPNLFFKQRVEETEVFLDAKKFTWLETVEKFSLLSQEFDWSPMGLALALKDQGRIKPDSHEMNRLMALNTKLSKHRKTIDALFFSNFEPANYDKLSSFFVEEVQKNKELFRPLIEIRNSAAFGRISPRRLAEILSIDSGDADELTRSWIAEQASGASQDQQDGSVPK